MIKCTNHGLPQRFPVGSMLFCSLFIGMFSLILTPSTASAKLDPTVDSSTVSTHRPTTLELIERAAAEGRITLDQRLIYLAYAIYEPESLPRALHGTGGWSGTQVVRELREVQHGQGAILSAAASTELHRVLSPSMMGIYCDQMDGNLTDESTYFAFTYSTDGATPIVGATIQDYKVALDKAYATIIETYGWARPPLCGADNVFDDPFDDECKAINPFGKIPVQITDAGAGVYGYVVGEGGNYAGFIGDNPNTPAEELQSTASCVVMDNDFLELASGDADEALRQIFATSAHEFFHAVQNAYGDPGTAQLGAMWAESTAAYFEDEVDDDANTQYQYLWPVTAQPLADWPVGGDPGEVSEYSNFLFFRHVAENHGGANSAAATAGHTVMRRYFELVAQDEFDRDIKLMNDALVAATPSTTLAQANHDYAIAAKFSKACNGGYTNPFCFEEGAQYVASNAETPGVQETLSAVGSRTYTMDDGFAIFYAALPTDGQTYDFSLTNNATNADITLQASLVCDSGRALAVTPVGVAAADSTVSVRGFATARPSGICNETVLVVTSANAALLAEQTNSLHAAATTNFSLVLSLGTAVPNTNIYLPLVNR